MGDEDWDQPSASIATNDTPFSSSQKDTNNLDNNNNNNESTEKPGFRGFGSNRDDNGGGGSGNKSFGFNRRNDDNNEGGNNRGGFGGGPRFGGGGGGGARFGGGGNRRNNEENGDGGNRGGFGGFGGNRRNNGDDNNGDGNNRGGGGGGGGFGRGFGGGNRRNNDENGEGGNRGFGGGGRRSNDNGGDSGNRGGFNNRRSNDENGGSGENRGFSGGFGRKNNDENGDAGNRGFGGNRRSNDGENRGFGGNSGGFGGGNRRNNDENGGERRSGFGGGGGGGFGRKNNDENGAGENRGFRKPRDGDDNNRSSGGFGFRNRDNADGDDNGGRGGFNRKRDDNNAGGGGGGGGFGFKNRDGSRGAGGGGGGFGGRDRSEGRGGEGGFRRDRSAPNRRDNNNNEDKAGGDAAPPKERYIPPEIGDDEKSLFDHQIPTGVNFKKQAEIPATLSGEDSDKIEAINNFKDAGLSELLLENIERSNYEIPTPVQKYAIPIILQKRDLMACAQTGSGKTAAYLIPILTNILHDGIESSELSTTQTPQALILSPTRELAIQIFSECKKFSFKSIIKSRILYGGTVCGHQMGEIAKGTNILVATPGRLIDVLKRGGISLEKVKYIVLDEADRMLDFGFESAVRDILSKCVLEKSQRNIFMFSATFPKEIQQLAQDFLQNYLFLTIGVVGGANTDVEQVLHKVDDNFKKRETLCDILNEIGSERTMIFVEQKKQADVLGFFLLQKGYPTTTIHGDRLQSQREIALRDFKQGDSKIIVCTSVAARGLDITGVKYVINYDLPQTIDEYVHRIGRTGRCGNLGKSISFFSTESENDRKLARNLVRILTQANKEVPSWLNDAAENCIGGVVNTKCTNDIRKIDKNFRSIAINDDEPTATASTSAAGGGDDEKWE